MFRNHARILELTKFFLPDIAHIIASYASTLSSECGDPLSLVVVEALHIHDFGSAVALFKSTCVELHDFMTGHVRKFASWPTYIVARAVPRASAIYIACEEEQLLQKWTVAGPSERVAAPWLGKEATDRITVSEDCIVSAKGSLIQIVNLATNVCVFRHAKCAIVGLGCLGETHILEKTIDGNAHIWSLSDPASSLSFLSTGHMTNFPGNAWCLVDQPFNRFQFWSPTKQVSVAHDNPLRAGFVDSKARIWLIDDNLAVFRMQLDYDVPKRHCCLEGRISDMYGCLFVETHDGLFLLSRFCCWKISEAGTAAFFPIQAFRFDGAVLEFGFDGALLRWQGLSTGQLVAKQSSDTYFVVS